MSNIPSLLQGIAPTEAIRVLLFSISKKTHESQECLIRKRQVQGGRWLNRAMIKNFDIHTLGYNSLRTIKIMINMAGELYLTYSIKL